MKVLTSIIPLHKNVPFSTAHLFQNAKVHQHCITKPHHTNGIECKLQATTLVASVHIQDSIFMIVLKPCFTSFSTGLNSW